MSVWQLLELLLNGTRLFPVWFSQNCSRNDLHPKVQLFVCLSRNFKDSEPKEAPHMVTVDKARSTSQRQIVHENTILTTEADQTLLNLQQLASNSNSFNFNKQLTQNFKTVQIPLYHNTDNDVWWKIRKIWTTWRSVLNKSQNTKTAHRRKQYKLIFFSDACWSALIVQKHQQPKWRHCGCNFDCSVENTWNPSQWLQRNTNFKN